MCVLALRVQYNQHPCGQRIKPITIKTGGEVSFRSALSIIRLTVTGLEDLDQYEVEERYGLMGVGKEPGGAIEFPLIQIEGIEDEANRQLIDDYSYWLANFT